jgi:hypothetical protein
MNKLNTSAILCLCDKILLEWNEETTKRKYLGQRVYDKAILSAENQILLENLKTNCKETFL